MNPIAFAVLAAVAVGSAHARPADGTFRPCARPPGVESIRARAELPQALREKFRTVAMPGEYWNPSDAGLPGSGFDFVWHERNRWVFLIGRGGIATVFGVQAFDVSDDGRSVEELPVPGDTDGAQSLCQLAVSYFKP